MDIIQISPAMQNIFYVVSFQTQEAWFENQEDAKGL